MGRKRLKNRLKRRIIRRGMKGKPKNRPQKAQNNPLDSFMFWLNLATIDFCGVFGLWVTGSTEERPPVRLHGEAVDE